MSDDLHLTFTKEGVLDTLHIADRVLVEQVEGGQGYEVTIWREDGSAVGIWFSCDAPSVRHHPAPSVEETGPF